MVGFAFCRAMDRAESHLWEPQKTRADLQLRRWRGQRKYAGCRHRACVHLLRHGPLIKHLETKREPLVLRDLLEILPGRPAIVD